MSSTVAIKQIMVPAVFFVAGLGLLAVSYMPNMQQHRMPSYPSTTTPLSTASVSVAPSRHPKVVKTVAPPPVAHTTAPRASAAPMTKASAVPGAKASPGTKKVTSTTTTNTTESTAIVRTPAGLIPATSSTGIQRDNPVTIGREDPFKSLLSVPKKAGLPPPPPIPGMPGVTAPAPGMGKPSAIPKPSAPPATPPPLKAGLSLQGLVTGDEEPAAILNVDGNTQLVRVGDVIRRAGYVVTVTNINERALSITLSDGKGHNDVLKTE